MPVLAPANGARRQRREGKRAAALKFMDKVEPLVAELIQCADTTLALRNDTDVAEAMLRFCGSASRACRRRPPNLRRGTPSRRLPAKT